MYGLAYCRLDYEYITTVDIKVLDTIITAQIDRENRDFDIDMQKLAWQTALLMTATGNYKHGVKPEKLYQPMKKEEVANKSNVSVEQQREELKRTFGLE